MGIEVFVFCFGYVRKSEFALGSPPLSGTVDKRIVTQKHVRWEMVSSKHFHYELHWNYFGPSREKFMVYNNSRNRIGWALRCLFSVSDMSGNEDFALGSPPLSGTVDRRSLRRSMFCEKWLASNFHYELRWRYFCTSQRNIYDL
ncbi:hypothetical protein CEXT_180971 [Caerostris extrusa]|uniref:Uncharacterized protein n=1 Tax=Caerostris extrusa TaxID=172846 RepID=A0AAV4X8B4_CAEEX|nr:hypothetical protein CEXT_180971 [Caerostris extrusa]